MKKIVLGVIVVMSSLFVAPMESMAQIVLAAAATTDKGTGDFYAVEVGEIPPILRDSIYTSYAGCMVKSAEISNNSTFVKYKVVLLAGNGKTYKVYFDDRGRVVKEHLYFE